jgi:hypothetical protein
MFFSFSPGKKTDTATGSKKPGMHTMNRQTALRALLTLDIHSGHAR